MKLTETKRNKILNYLIDENRRMRKDEDVKPTNKVIFCPVCNIDEMDQQDYTWLQDLFDKYGITQEARLCEEHKLKA